MDVYLDIEFSFRKRLVTVLGAYRKDIGFRQLVGAHVNQNRILELLEGCHCVVTFNGDCCEIPVIRKRFGVDLKQGFESCDLLKVCRQRKIRGKLKEVEKEFGIQRRFPFTGQQAMRFWHWYRRNGDSLSLKKLLAYNREDVMNLVELHQKLAASQSASVARPSPVGPEVYL